MTGDLVSEPASLPSVEAVVQVMLLNEGTFCVHHLSDSTAPDRSTGLPVARLSTLPGPDSENVSMVGFSEDGWMGPLNSAMMIRVSKGPAYVLVTTYHDSTSSRPLPRLQVVQLVQDEQSVPVKQEIAIPQPAGAAPTIVQLCVREEVFAHLRQRGDVAVQLGEWLGERGSGCWVEGFSISPQSKGLAPHDLEYQGVLGQNWITPWMEGGQYCGSRGMSLPLLGLRVRLRGEKAAGYAVKLSADFTDGSVCGPVDAGETCQSRSLAPLEAFRVEILQRANKRKSKVANSKRPAGRRR
jgi:hypothetical protein